MFDIQWLSTKELYAIMKKDMTFTECHINGTYVREFDCKMRCADMAEKRDSAVDLIKAIAIFGVLVIHVDASVLTQGEAGSFEWLCGLFWGSLVRGSVPLFLMASGAIMLDARKKLSMKRLYFHNIARIAAAMLVWGFCYKLYHLLAAGQLNTYAVWHSIKRLLLFDQEFHFYYIHMILLVYAFLPITRIFAEKADKKTVEYALCLWTVLGIVYPALRNFTPFTMLSGIPCQWAVNLTYSSIGYGLLGYYLKKYPLPRKKGGICACIGFFITFGMTCYLSVKAGRLNDMFLLGTSPGVFLLAVGIFSLANGVKLKKHFGKAVEFASKASFCVYLLHMFGLYAFTGIGITPRILPAAFSVPIISGLALALCLAVYALLSKIPFLNKWII